MLGCAINGAKLTSSAGSPLDDLAILHPAEPDSLLGDAAPPPPRGAAGIAVGDFNGVALSFPASGLSGDGREEVRYLLLFVPADGGFLFGLGHSSPPAKTDGGHTNVWVSIALAMVISPMVRAPRRSSHFGR